MKKTSKNNTSLGSSFSDMAIPIVIILVFVVAGGIVLINSLSTLSNSDEITVDIWEEAFREVERNKVGISFEPIVTTEDIYTILRVECNKYIEQVDKEPDTVVSVKTTVDEDIFVDGAEQLDDKEGTNNVMVDASETGPIYFNDRILIRYMNDSGELKIVTSSIDNETGEVEVYNKKNIRYTNKLEYNDELNKSLLSESEYLNILKDTTVGILTAKTNKELKDYQRNALTYFTLDGSKTVIDGRATVNKNNKSKIEVQFIEAGKSSLNVTYKDRVYMHVKAVDGDEVDIYGIILKLDQNSRIFDIDII